VQRKATKLIKILYYLENITLTTEHNYNE